jgi:hypothetical protein
MQNEINGEFYWRLRRPKIVTKKKIIINQKKPKSKTNKKFKREIIEAMIRD